jgi:hypothetical protein
LKIPGWASIEAVNRVHLSLEVVGLSSFALAVVFEGFHMGRSSLAGFAILVICEILAFVYGRREKVLSDLRSEREQALIKRLEARLADRSISPEQQHFLIDKLKGFAGQQAIFEVNPSDVESTALYVQLREVLTKAGWNAILGGRSGVSQLGISLRLGGAFREMDQLALSVLSSSLIECGLHVEPTAWVIAPRGPREHGWITVIVGRNV